MTLVLLSPLALLLPLLLLRWVLERIRTWIKSRMGLLTHERSCTCPLSSWGAAYEFVLRSMPHAWGCWGRNM